MQTKQGNGLNALGAVRDFLDAHADKLAAVNQTGARKSLDDLLAELSGHAATQTGGAMGAQSSTRKKEELRRALIRDHMVPIARIAKSELPDSPELEPLRMPKGRLTVQKLAGHATGMAQAATPFTDLFVASGRPADFVAQLQTASAAMVNAVNQRTNAKGAVHGATVGVKRALSRGRKIVGVLDSFVNSALANDPVLLAAWEKVKRVQLFNGRPTPNAPNTPSTPSTPATPTSPSTPAAPHTPTTAPAAAASHAPNTSSGASSSTGSTAAGGGSVVTSASAPAAPASPAPSPSPASQPAAPAATDHPTTG